MRKAARPHGTVGMVLARIWVSETAAVNDTAIELLAPAPGERICEIGFGPGRTLGRLSGSAPPGAGPGRDPGARAHLRLAGGGRR